MAIDPLVRIRCRQAQAGIEVELETSVELSTFTEAQLDKFLDVLLYVTEATDGIPGYASKKKLPDAENERRRGHAIERTKRGNRTNG